MGQASTESRVDRFAHALHELWYYQRSSAHVLAGWIVKIPEFDLKKAAARALYQRMSAAVHLERTLDSLKKAAELKMAVPSAARTRMMDVDRSATSAEVLEGLFLELGPHLVELHRKAIGLGDELWNGPILEMLQVSLSHVEGQLGWAKKALGARHSKAETSEWQALWGDDERSGEVLWQPLDRAPEAARPAHCDRGIPGALRALPLDANTDRAGIGLILHNNVNGEYTTMELVARCSYEHPDMRLDFHLDMARHASDEARHAGALERLALDYGVKYGDLPVYSYTYDGLYQFGTCPIGSREELLWRLLLRATVQEGSSLDDLVFQAKRREYLDQHEIADTFRSILADELFHVRGGLKWTRELCKELGKDELKEREKARAHYEAGILVRRRRFLQEHPDLAAKEAAYQKEMADYRRENAITLPMELTLQVDLRKSAGFTDDDIAQARKWEF